MLGSAEGSLRRPALIVVVAALAAFGVFAGQGRDASSPAAAAVATAVAPGQPALVRELPSLRTRNSKTYADESGTLTARVYAGSVHHQGVDGAWLPIDNTLVKTQSGFRNRANNYLAELPKTLAAPIKVTRGERWVSFRLNGGKGAVTTSGDTATYARALRGVDASYVAGADVLKETLTLADASAVRSFSFDLAASGGLVPTLLPAGGVAFDDADGATRFSFGAPFMVDAAGAESLRFEQQLVPIKGGWRLSVVPSAAWLDDPSRRWPVKVDPGTWPVGDPDCGISQATPETSTCTATSLKLGAPGGSHRRALLRFAVNEALPVDATVLSSTLAINLRSQTAPAAPATPVGLHRVTRSWNGSATWNRHDGANRWGDPGGDYDPALVAGVARSVGGTRGLGRYYWDAKSLVEAWSRGEANHGLLLRPHGTGLPDNEMTFDSAEMPWSDTASPSVSWPAIDVRYTRRLGEQPGYGLESFRLSDRMELKVNVGTGNLMLRQAELSVPGGLGPDLAIGRTYNSYGLGPTGPSYGEGWRMDTASGIYLDDHGGNSQKYLAGPSGFLAGFESFYNSSTGQSDYKTPPGLNAKLTNDADGGNTITFNQSQAKWKFENVASDGRARLKSVKDRNDRQIQFAYDGTSSRVLTITDSQDRITTFAWDAAGRVDSMTDSAGRLYDHRYDANGRLDRYTDPNGNHTYYHYDVDGRLSKVVTPGNRTTLIDYYAAGDPRAGKVKSVTRVTDTVANTGPKTTFDYLERRDSSGDGWVLDPSLHETKYVFDNRSRVTEVTDPLGNKQSNAYTSNSNVQTYSAPGNSTGSASATFNWDDDGNQPKGNLLSTTVPTKAGDTTKPSMTSTFGYPGTQAAGGTVTGGVFLPKDAVDENGGKKTFSYTAGGNLANVVGVKSDGTPASQVTLNYDPAWPGKLTSTVDGNGNTTSYGYDPKGNLTSVTPPSPIGGDTYAYGGASGQDLALSRITTATHPGWSEAFTYDGLDRVLTVTYGTSNTITNTYDGDGNLTQVADSVNGTRVMTYDALNRLKTQAGPGTTSFTYGYDQSSNLTSVQDNYGTTEYGYDAANRNVSVYLPGVTTPVKFTLDKNGRREKIAWPNGNTTEQSFNDAGQMLETCVAGTVPCASSASRRLRLKYTYRAVDSARQSPLQELVEDATGATSSFTRYCYDLDGLDRLKRVETAATAGTALCAVADAGDGSSFAYTYDGAGNITERRRNGTLVDTFAYNGANRLCWKATTAGTCGTPPVGATTYGYNTAGNETSQTNGGTGSRTSSTYNARNQLSAFVVGGVTTNLAHFGSGHSDLLSAGGTTRRNSALGILSIGSDTYQRDETGGLVSQSTGSGREYFHLDALGSVRKLTGSTGSATRTFNYDPYGDPLTSSPNKPDPGTSRFGYASGEFIEQGGLYHFGARYYDPKIMRWTTPDPLLNHDDIRQANRYAYVGGDPINSADPSGTHTDGPGYYGPVNPCSYLIHTRSAATLPTRCRNASSYALARRIRGCAKEGGKGAVAGVVGSVATGNAAAAPLIGFGGAVGGCAAGAIWP